MEIRQITIINRLGLHARAAAKLVATASRFSSKIEIARNDKYINAKSIMGVMMIGASQGTELTITTSGEDEQEAMGAIIQLIENRFGEEH